MEQLTYTSCRPGKSLNGFGGYTVRAASAGINPTWLIQAPRLARCDLKSLSKGSDYVRLAFHWMDNSSIVSHTVRVLDHETRIASFTHVVIDTTGRLGPREAIGAWGSKLWERTSGNGPTELGSFDHLTPGDVLSWADLQRRLEQPAFAALAQFVLSSWLSHGGQPIVLFADDDAVAAVIWLLTRSLPTTQLRDCSFVTNDHDPATAGTAITGSRMSLQGLPRAAIENRQWFDALTGKASNRSAIAYADFVICEASAGRWEAIKAFVDRCEDLGIQTADEISLVHSVVHKGYVCTEADLLGVRQRPTLLRWLIKDDRHAQIAFRFIERSATSASNGIVEFVAALHVCPEQSKALKANLLARAGEELRAGRNQSATRWIDLCRHDESPGNVASLWHELFEYIAHTELSVETRASLAEQLRVEGEAPKMRPLVERLLSFNMKSLYELLESSIDDAIKAEACGQSVYTGQTMTPSVVQSLSRQPALLARLLRATADPMAVASAITAHHPMAVLDLLCVDEALGRRINAEALLIQVMDTDGLSVKQLLSSAILPHWRILLTGRHAGRVIGGIMSASLAAHSPVEIGRVLRLVLDTCRLSSEFTKLVNRRLCLVDLLSNPSIRIGEIEHVVLAINELAEQDRRKVFKSLWPCLMGAAARSTEPNMQKKLAPLLDLALSLADRSPDNILREFANATNEAGRLLKDPPLAALVLAHAFGSTGQGPRDRVSHNRLIDLGMELIELYARAGGPEFNHAVRGLAAKWSDPARSFYRIASQQRRVNGRLGAFLARRKATLMEL